MHNILQGKFLEVATGHFRFHFLSQTLGNGHASLQEGGQVCSLSLCSSTPRCAGSRRRCAWGSFFHRCLQRSVYFLPPSTSSFIFSGALSTEPEKPRGSVWHPWSAKIFGGRNRNWKQAGRLSSFLLIKSLSAGDIIQEAATRQALEHIRERIGKGKKHELDWAQGHAFLCSYMLGA